MTDERIYPYEGLFLFPQAQIADLQAAQDHICEILERAGAKLISLRKWDERRLAFEIKGNKRGVYFLAYFRAHGEALAGIDRDCNLSELLLRAMVTRADHLSQEMMEATDGRAELADEIKLRATDADEEAKASTRAKPPAEVNQTDKPVTVETQPAPTDKAATEA